VGFTSREVSIVRAAEIFLESRFFFSTQGSSSRVEIFLLGVEIFFLNAKRFSSSPGKNSSTCKRFSQRTDYFLELDDLFVIVGKIFVKLRIFSST